MTKIERKKHADFLATQFLNGGVRDLNYTERQGESRGTLVATWVDPKTGKPTLRCLVWIGTIGGGGHNVTLHWHDAKSKLDPAVLSNVNSAHGLKATSGFIGTDYAHSVQLAANWLAEHADDFLKGKVFLPVPVNG